VFDQGLKEPWLLGPTRSVDYDDEEGDGVDADVYSESFAIWVLVNYLSGAR
jgi:hypothetical protein